jgi:hypothetical protein
VEWERQFPSKRSPRLVGEWSFHRATKAPGAWIVAMNVQTSIEPGDINITPPLPGEEGMFTFDRWDTNRWRIAGHSNKILNLSEWRASRTVWGHEISSDEQIALQWHRWLLEGIFSSWERSFAETVKTGTTQIMARKQSVLAPFERITWNQWQCFRMDELPAMPLPRASNWGDPRAICYPDLPWTATGPSGEKLYEIHIAPGLAEPVSIEKQCEHLLVKLLMDHPNRPKPLPELAKQICSEFPGLSERAFRQCLLRAQEQTGNRKWSKAGRQNSPQKSLHQT